MCCRYYVDLSPELRPFIEQANRSPLRPRMVEALGANSIAIAYSECYSSLQTGVCDGAIGLTPVSAQSSFGDLVKYWVPQKIFIDPLDYTISQATWDKLPADLQQVVRDVANKTVLEFEVDYVKNHVAGAYEKMQADGMEVVVPSAEFQADIDAAFAGMADWFLETYPEAQEVYDDFVARIEADTGEYDRF